MKDFKKVEDVRLHLKSNSHNFKKVLEIRELAEGGESKIFQLKVIQPIEIVIKTPIKMVEKDG